VEPPGCLRSSGTRTSLIRLPAAAVWGPRAAIIIYLNDKCIQLFAKCLFPLQISHLQEHEQLTILSEGEKTERNAVFCTFNCTEVLQWLE
jgi:hypothetical protein